MSRNMSECEKCKELNELILEKGKHLWQLRKMLKKHGVPLKDTKRKQEY